jgi:3-oxoacyl-[acyl-carrier protein] reductase
VCGTRGQDCGIVANNDGEAVHASSNTAASLTVIIAREVGGFEVTVNTVVLTAVHADQIGGTPKDKFRAVVEQQAIRRPGAFADIANVTDCSSGRKVTL